MGRHSSDKRQLSVRVDLCDRELARLRGSRQPACRRDCRTELLAEEAFQGVGPGPGAALPGANAKCRPQIGQTQGVETRDATEEKLAETSSLSRNISSILRNTRYIPILLRRPRANKQRQPRVKPRNPRTEARHLWIMSTISCKMQRNPARMQRIARPESRIARKGGPIALQISRFAGLSRHPPRCRPWSFGGEKTMSRPGSAGVSPALLYSRHLVAVLTTARSTAAPHP